MTPEELRLLDGRDPSKPLCLAVRGVVFDVTQGAGFYGPGGTYHVFAGRECARALGLMLIEEKECSGDVSTLTDKQMEILQDWEARLRKKYPIIGQIPRHASAATPQAPLAPPQAAEAKEAEAGEEVEVAPAAAAAAHVVPNHGAQAGRHVTTSGHYWVSIAAVCLLLALLAAAFLPRTVY